jgi:putative ABC transport system substrate-binding protein
MNRKITVLTLCAMLFALCPSASAQQPKKVPGIGYLSSNDPATESNRAEVIRLALRELGYVEGQNIATEYRYSEGERGRLPSLPPSWCVSRLMSSW